MGTQVTIVYKVAAVGKTPAQLEPFVASAPIPADVLAAFGLRVSSDSTTTANPIVRTIILEFNPSSAAMIAGATFTNTNRILSVPVDPTNKGLDYIRPPIVTADNNKRTPAVLGTRKSANPASDYRFDDPPMTQVDAVLKAYLDVEGSTKIAGGAGYTAPTVVFLGGLPPANKTFTAGAVRYINIAKSGFGYPTGSKVVIKGGGPGGVEPAVPAQVTTVLDGVGGIKSAVITDMGRGYISVPEVAVVSAGGVPVKRVAELYAVMAEGTPATATANLTGDAVTSLTMTDAGDGYVEVPDIAIYDPAGTGAIYTAQMGVGRVDIINPGIGYEIGTTFTITPFFQSLFPTGEQAFMFFEFLESTIANFAITPVQSDTPVVA